MRETYLESIAKTLSDFRVGELKVPTPQHVDRWISQFDETVQLPMLKEIDHVLQKSYCSKENVSAFFRNLIRSEKLAGKNYCDFWKTAHILNIQQNGHSQSEIRSLFGNLLLEECGLDINLCGIDGGPYIYIDDILFTGGRIGQDLISWMPSAPDRAVVHIIVIGAHKLGEWQCTKNLESKANANNKNITFTIWAAMRLENRKKYKNHSDVLWPAILPEYPLVSEYMAREAKYPFEPRQPGGRPENQFFSNEEARQLLETQFLLAGLKIISFSQSPKPAMKPLGFSPFGLGFGSTIVTYRNCPNNAPLALWWGSPEMPVTHPLGRWYPLVQRKVYATELGSVFYDMESF